MFHHFLNNQISIPNPTFRLFDRLSPSGVGQLDPSLTINGQTVTPTFRYKGGDADGADWDAWTYGDTATAAGSGGTFNNGSPCLGSNDDSVDLAGSRYYTNGTSLGNPGTDDFVIEFLLKKEETGNNSIISKVVSGSDRLLLRLNGAFIQLIVNATSVNVSDALTNGAIYHGIIFYDKSGNSQMYINGVASGGAGSVSGVGSISNGAVLTFGATTGGADIYDASIMYLAMWQKDAWLDTHLQATIAQDRFNRLIGIHPPKAEGTTVPTVQTRASVAYIDKLEDSNTTRKLYQVGDNWLRKVSRLDSNGDEIQGYLPETTATNLCLQSEDFGTTWTSFDAGDTIGGSVVTPNKSTSITAGLIPDSTDGQHYIQQAVTLTAATYTFSVFAKKGSQDWIGLYNNLGTAGGRYFDISTGVLGGNIAGTPTESFIEDWGDGWFRCGISFTGTAASHNCRIYSAEADGDGIFAGDGATVSTYLWGAQVELEDYMTSYIPTTTGTATRDDDQLRFLGDDGNIGGVGSELKGTFVSDILLPDYDSSLTRTMLQLSDAGASTDRIIQRVGTADALDFLSRATGGASGDIAGSIDVVDNVIHNVRCTWIVNNIKQYLDNVSEGVPDIVADVPDDLDRIDVGVRNAINQFNGVLSSVKLSPAPTTVGPTFRLFEPDRALGVDTLDPFLTINGQTVTPTFRYKGGDATGTNWPAWGYGETLTLQAGTAPSYNQGSPCLGSNDDSVQFNNGGYYQGTVGPADVETEDFVVECIFRRDNVGTTDGFLGTKDGGNEGWEFRFSSATPYLNIEQGDGTNISAAIASSVDQGAWYHILIFLDRSGNATGYMNGIAGTDLDISAVTATLAASTPFVIGARGDGSLPVEATLAYCAMWKKSNWLDTSLQAGIAAERFHKLTGMWPSRAGGTAAPTLSTRASEAYLDKLESGNRKLYQVGDNWLRLVDRDDSASTNIKGYLAELAVTNLMLYSQDFTQWTQVDADDLVADGYTAVDKSTTATGFTASATNGGHGVARSATVTADTYTFSAWVKKGDQDWCRLLNVTLVIGAYFDLVNGVVGTETGAITESFIEDWGDGWFRCGYSFTGTAASHTFRIYSNEADNDTTFIGDGINVNLYMWGAQVELGAYMTSYIPTTTGTAVRNKDDLYYKGDDGNLGGVGSELQGTIACNSLFESSTDTSTKGIVCLNDGGSSERIYVYNTSVLTARTDKTAGNSGVATSSVDGSDGVVHLTRMTWAADDVKLYVDDTLDGTDVSADIPPNLDRINVGNSQGSTQQSNAVISDLRIFKVPITQG